MRVAKKLPWLGVLALCVAGPATSQDKPQPQDKASGAPAMAAPQPGPEHQMLAKDAGVWEATVESWMEPGKPPAISKGVETNTMMGGMWLVTDFKAEFMGSPFQGHGVTGYDPIKKKFVGTWVDTMSAAQNLSEGTYDPTTKTLTGYIDGPGPDGKPARMKQVSEWKDPDTRVFTMYPPNGNDPMMRITYKRQK